MPVGPEKPRVLFATFPFLAFGLVTVIVTNLTKKGLSDPALYLVINAVFLGLFLGRFEALLLIGFALWGYMMLRVPALIDSPAIVFGIASTLLLFVFLKKSAAGFFCGKTLDSSD